MLNIPAEFGGQELTFVTPSSSGQPGYLGLTGQAEAEISVSGCRFRPVSASEENASSEGGSAIRSTAGVATGMWKATCPPVDAVLEAKPNGMVKVGEAVYTIEGPVMPRVDMYGQLHHVTVMCRKQSTGE